MYDASKHHRRSIRLKDYDYSQPGLYFITICCQEKKLRFGDIRNGEMCLNECGKIATQEWKNLLQRYPVLETDIFQIMPNHIHGVIAIGQNNLDNTTCNTIVGAYKSIVFNKCLEIYKASNIRMDKLWQRNYYEHIIRNKKSYDIIYNYIVNNPKTWHEDKFYMAGNDE